MSIMKSGISACWLLLLSVPSMSTGSTFPPAIKSISVDGRNGYYFVLSKLRDATMTCEADEQEGSDIASIEWRPANEVTIPTDWKRTGNNFLSVSIPNIEISRNSVRYEGFYTCIIRNSAGIAVSSQVEIRFAEVFATETTSIHTVTALLNSTVVLPCNSTAPISFTPDLRNFDVDFIWYYYQPTQIPNNPGRTLVDPSVDPRFAISDDGKLYIRNVRKSDERLKPQVYQCYVSSELASRNVKTSNYELQVSEVPTVPGSAPTLIYKSPNVEAKAHSSVYLTCIFEDSTGDVTVEWEPRPEKVFQKGATILLENVTSAQDRIWTCKYKGVSGSIAVRILEYPLIASESDAYVNTSDKTELRCTVTTQGEATWTWYRNDNAITSDIFKYVITNVFRHSTLTIQNITKKDSGVYRCSARNNQGTISLNRRLIVSDRAILKVLAFDSSTSDGESSEAVIGNSTTEIRFLCKYSIDAAASGVKVMWQLENYNGNVTEATKDPEFGLELGSVATDSQQSMLKIQVIPENAEKIRGYVQCSVRYYIMNKEYFEASENRGKISGTAKSAITQPSDPFPFWIIGVILAAMLAVVIVIFVVRHMRKNKGEQYYVEKKENQSGNSRRPSQAWTEFKRPDQDPPRASVSSLQVDESGHPYGDPWRGSLSSLQAEESRHSYVISTGTLHIDQYEYDSAIAAVNHGATYK